MSWAKQLRQVSNWEAGKDKNAGREYTFEEQLEYFKVHGKFPDGIRKPLSTEEFQYYEAKAKGKTIPGERIKPPPVTLKMAR